MKKWILFALVLVLNVSCKKSIDEASEFLGRDVLEDFDQAYFAVNGRGEGTGRYGHAYLILKPATANRFGSISYHFYIRPVQKFAKKGVAMPDISPQDMLEHLMKVGPRSPKYPSEQFPFEFALHKEPFAETLKTLAQEQTRKAFIYRLRIVKSQINKLYNLLEAERKEREAKPRFDYNLISFNCLHAAVEILNKVLIGTEKVNIKPITLGPDLLAENNVDMLSFVPSFMLYTIEKNRYDLFEREDLGQLASMDDKRKNAFIIAEKIYKNFFTVWEKVHFDLYKETLKYSDAFQKQKESMLNLLLSSQGSDAGLKIFYEQLYAKADKEGRDLFLVRKKKIEWSEKSCAQKEFKTLLMRDDFIRYDELIAVWYKVDPTQVALFAKAVPEFFDEDFTRWLHVHNYYFPKDNYEGIPMFTQFLNAYQKCSEPQKTAVQSYVRAVVLRRIFLEQLINIVNAIPPGQTETWDKIRSAIFNEGEKMLVDF